MSPPSIVPGAPSADRLATRIAVELGTRLREARVRRGWTLAEVARRARTTVTTVQRLEAGGRGSLDGYSRRAVALGLEPSFSMSTPRREVVRDADAVHAAIGEAEAVHLYGARHRSAARTSPTTYLAPDLYQFAGRADVLGIDRPCSIRCPASVGRVVVGWAWMRSAGSIRVTAAMPTRSTCCGRRVRPDSLIAPPRAGRTGAARVAAGSRRG